MLSEVGLSEGQSHAVEASLPAQRVRQSDDPRCIIDLDLVASFMTFSPNSVPNDTHGETRAKRRKRSL
jgi:hypothetical protein